MTINGRKRPHRRPGKPASRREIAAGGLPINRSPAAVPVTANRSPAAVPVTVNRSPAAGGTSYTDMRKKGYSEKRDQYGNIRWVDANGNMPDGTPFGSKGQPAAGGTVLQQAQATAQPATAQPATAQPATAQPATAQPATAQPATAQPATDDHGLDSPEPGVSEEVMRQTVESGGALEPPKPVDPAASDAGGPRTPVPDAPKPAPGFYNSPEGSDRRNSLLNSFAGIAEPKPAEPKPAEPQTPKVGDVRLVEVKNGDGSFDHLRQTWTGEGDKAGWNGQVISRAEFNAQTAGRTGEFTSIDKTGLNGVAYGTETVMNKGVGQPRNPEPKGVGFSQDDFVEGEINQAQSALQNDLAQQSQPAGTGQEFKMDPDSTSVSQPNTQPPPDFQPVPDPQTEEEDQAASKGGEGEDRFATSRNFLATDKVPDSIFGYPIASRREDYTPEDLVFFKEHPEAGGYYDLGDSEEPDVETQLTEE